MNSFLSLSHLVAGAAMSLWPISLGLLVAFVGANIRVSPSLRGRHLRNLLFVLSLLVGPLGLVLVGVAFAIPSGNFPATNTGEILLKIFAFATIAAATMIIASSGRGLRLRTAAMVLLILWFALGAYFVSFMSVTGNWL